MLQGFTVYPPGRGGDLRIELPTWKATSLLATNSFPQVREGTKAPTLGGIVKALVRYVTILKI